MERCLPNRSWPIGRDQSSLRPNLRLQQAAVGFEIFVIEPAIIAHPTGVNVIVLARRLTIDDVLASSDDCIAPRRATCADALRFFQEPDPHFETEIGRSQCAHRANVDGVKRIIVFQRPAGMRRKDRVTAAIDEPEYVVVRNFVAETNAARAENATLVIKRYPRAELDRFRLFHFVLKETRLRTSIVDTELLQTAFTGLIADRAVERVIDQEKLHDAALTFLHER